MIELQSMKVVNACPPGAIKDNGSFTTTVIDTFGYDYLVVSFALGATDIAMAALKLTESDDSGMGGATDITGSVYGTSSLPQVDGGGTSALPSATDDDGIFQWFVDLRGKKRYIKLVATAGDGTSGTYGAAVAFLGRGDVGPYTATDKGVVAQLIC